MRLLFHRRASVRVRGYRGIGSRKIELARATPETINALWTSALAIKV